MLTPDQKIRLEHLIADLRANPDKQGYGRLRSDGKFCCLGRACDLYDSQGWSSTSYGIYFQVKSKSVLDTITTEKYTLLKEVMDFYGFPHSNGIVDEDITDKNVNGELDKDQSWSLTQLNDAEQFTFPMIADIIQYWMENN
jgi:hypothetical protein